MGSGYAQVRSLKIGAHPQNQGFQIVDTSMNWGVVERALNIVIIGNGFETEELAKTGKSLDFESFAAKTSDWNCSNCSLILSKSPSLMSPALYRDSLISTVF